MIGDRNILRIQLFINHLYPYLLISRILDLFQLVVFYHALIRLSFCYRYQSWNDISGTPSEQVAL